MLGVVKINLEQYAMIEKLLSKYRPTPESKGAKLKSIGIFKHVDYELYMNVKEQGESIRCFTLFFTTWKNYYIFF